MMKLGQWEWMLKPGWAKGPNLSRDRDRFTKAGKQRMKQRRRRRYQYGICQTGKNWEIWGDWSQTETQAMCSAWQAFVKEKVLNHVSRLDEDLPHWLGCGIPTAPPQTREELDQKKEAEGNARKQITESFKSKNRVFGPAEIRHAYFDQPHVQRARRILDGHFRPARDCWEDIDRLYLAIAQLEGLVAAKRDRSGFRRSQAFWEALGNFLNEKSSTEAHIFQGLLEDAEWDERGNKCGDMMHALREIHNEFLEDLKSGNTSVNVSGDLYNNSELRELLSRTPNNEQEFNVQRGAENQLMWQVGPKWYQHRYFRMVYNFVTRRVTS